MIHSVMFLHCSTDKSPLRISPKSDCLLPEKLVNRRTNFQNLFQAGHCRLYKDDGVWMTEEYIEDQSISLQNLKACPA